MRSVTLNSLLAVTLVFLSVSCTAPAQNREEVTGNKGSQIQTGTQLGCLPPDISLDTVVAVTRSANGLVSQETVRERLQKLHAVCKGGRLVDRGRREIRFYKLQGCWGNPPQDYLEILDKQRKELEALSKKYTVIELTCNPSGQMPY